MKKIIKPLDLKKQAEALIAAGKMPSLDEVCRVILETRKEYAVKIRRGRRENKIVEPVQ